MKVQEPDIYLPHHEEKYCFTWHNGCNCTVQTLQRSWELLEASNKVIDIIKHNQQELERNAFTRETMQDLSKALNNYEQVRSYKSGLFSTNNLKK